MIITIVLCQLEFRKSDRVGYYGYWNIDMLDSLMDVFLKQIVE